MTEFCEGCPMKGKADGELDVAVFMPVEGGSYDMLGRPVTEERYIVGVIVDTEGNPSEPIHKGAQTTDTLVRRVENCPGVELKEEKRLFRKPQAVEHCPAIGKLAVKPSTRLYNLVAKEAAL